MYAGSAAAASGAAAAKLISGVHRDYETDAGKNPPMV
jgi:hypothetical protein